MPHRLTCRPDTRRRSAGAATLEYSAAIAMVALLIGAVVVPMKAAPVAETVRVALCKVYTALGEGGSCGSPVPPDPDHPVEPPLDPKPTRCKVTEHGEKVTSEVKIAFVKIGENAGFIETTYSDGTVTYTATDGASAGLTGGFGTKLDIGKVERGARVDFGADLKFDYGSTWTFANAKEAAAMKKQLDDYLTEQEIIKHNPEYSIKFLWSDPKEPPKPPNLHVSTVEVSGSVDGHVGLSLPFPKSDPDSDSGVPNLTLSDFGLKFGGSNKWTQITDTVTGSKTYTTSGEGYGEVHGTVGPLAGELRGVLGSSLAVTRDKNNQVTKVTLVTTREGKATSTTTAGQKDLGGSGSDADGASHATVTTASLDVKTPEQRALVDAWLAEQAGDPNAYVSPETYYPDRLAPGDPFQNLMFTNGVVSNVEYNNVSDKQGFAAEVKLGVAFGIDLSLETTDSKATAATYLGVPTPEGTRPPVDFPECVSK
ncbi:hypothetical protein [uncultured Friedmanniella sp.]|uniref:hypothetical protein n=1 Tax=uncultured Friedmanniella sp. TaxID=335381 RepID=UPI0035CB68E6